MLCLITTPGLQPGRQASNVSVVIFLLFPEQHCRDFGYCENGGTCEILNQTRNETHVYIQVEQGGKVTPKVHYSCRCPPFILGKTCQTREYGMNRQPKFCLFKLVMLASHTCVLLGFDFFDQREFKMTCKCSKACLQV